MKSGILRAFPLAVWGTLLTAALSFAEAPSTSTPLPEQANPEGASTPPAGAAQEQTFTIRRFVIEGSTLIPPEELNRQVAPFVGRKKTAAAVEGARDALERYFHDQGYPTVMVNIPEQAVQNKVIRLVVVENPVGSVTVTGNRYFTTEKILRDLPSIAPGEVIRLQQLQTEVNRLNRNPDFKVVPDMQPGKAPETVDLTLKVTDRSPLHGSVELNNRSSLDTTALRLSGTLRYDNLWQREHSFSTTYQVSPEDPEEVEVVSSSYTLPAPWDRDDKLVVYGVWSNTNTTTVSGFNNLGKGFIAGSRAIHTLPAVGDYSHTFVLGVDYKSFDETTGLAGSPGQKSPIQYLPVSAAYSASLRDGGGSTNFNGAVNLSFRGLVSDPRQFEDKRYHARGNYLFATAGVERKQELPGECSLLVRLDGQLADQPLIANEQYVAGGMDTVRGYHESERSGDDAIHAVFELTGPDLLKAVGKERFTFFPYVFYEGAGLWVHDALTGQEGRTGLQGTGVGVKGTLFGSLAYQTDLAFALMDSPRVSAGSAFVHFRMIWEF